MLELKWRKQYFLKFRNGFDSDLTYDLAASSCNSSYLYTSYTISPIFNVYSHKVLGGLVVSMFGI